MLKLGIVRRSQFLDAPSTLPARIIRELSKSRVSLHLLNLPEEPSEHDIALFERLMPFVRLSSGVYRTTARDRFVSLDPVADRIIMEHFSQNCAVHIEDWAASDCLTSYQWAKTLLPLYPNLTFTASDLLLFLVEAQNQHSEERFIFQPDGAPLQHVAPPFVIRMGQPERWTTPLNRILYARALRRWSTLKRNWSAPAGWTNPLQHGETERSGWILRKLPLVHPESLRLARRDPRFSVAQHSVFERSSVLCDVIRTMNIFNRAYFSDEQLLSGAQKVIESLKPGGLWIVGRTVREAPAEHEVTFLRKQEDGSLAPIHRVGPGSEIENLTLSKWGRNGTP